MQGVRACHGMDSAGMVLDAGAGLAVTRSYFVACQFFCATSWLVSADLA